MTFEYSKVIETNLLPILASAYLTMLLTYCALMVLWTGPIGMLFFLTLLAGFVIGGLIAWVFAGTVHDWTLSDPKKENTNFPQALCTMSAKCEDYEPFNLQKK